MSDQNIFAPRKIVIIAPPGVTLQDLTGPYEVFSRAEKQSPGSYVIQTVSCGSNKRVTTKFGLEIHCDLLLSQVNFPLDTLIVAGSDAALENSHNSKLLTWLKRASQSSRRTVSVCTGSFHLAQAGLLDGLRATTHWKYLELFQQLYPKVLLEPDPIYTQDEQIYTSAGITAGIDLSLALVEEDCSVDVAQAVARELVVFFQRPADQAQLSSALSIRMADRDPIRYIQQWAPDNLKHISGVEDLASKANMSVRNFSRKFKKETGSSPGVWLRKLRKEMSKN